MKRNEKEPLLPEIAVPMHETSTAFKSKIERDEVPDDSDVATALRGIENVDSHLKKINDVREKIMADQTMNDAGKKAAYLKFYNKIKPAVQRDIERLSTVVDKKTNEIHDRISRPVSDEAGGRFAHEIRQHVKSLDTTGDRLSEVKKFIDKEDFESASAVLGSKYYLAGLSEEHQQNLLDYYRNKRFSDDMKVRNVMHKVGDSVLHKLGMLSRFEKKISGADSVAALESQRAREEAMS